jgi:hypothetical protein
VLILEIISCIKTYATFDFRQVAWGMSPAEVLDAEKKDYPNLKFDENNDVIRLFNVGLPYDKYDSIFYRFLEDKKLAVIEVNFFSDRILDAEN